MKLPDNRDIKLCWVFTVLPFLIIFLSRAATSEINLTERQNGIEITETLKGNESIAVTTQKPIQFSTVAAATQNYTSKADAPNISTTSKATSCKCGIASSATGKIVGGTPVNGRNSWPWFAPLVRVDQPTKVHCGASLLTARHLLTAAHCIHPMIQAGLRNFRVKLGYNELYKTQGEEKQNTSEDDNHDKFDVPIESVTVHPQYEQSFPYHYDIGVVKLAYSINCTHKVRPICLPADDFDEKFYADESAINVGFGRTELNGNHSRVLQQIQLRLLPKSECNYNFSKLHFKAPELLDSMLCAWAKGKDACVGDSGSPLFHWRKTARQQQEGNIETSSHFEQIGIVSWGIGCASGFPGVYSKVSKFLPWLKSVVNFSLPMI